MAINLRVVYLNQVGCNPH